MSERMTNDEVGKHLGTAIAAADPVRRTESAVALSKEIARAHTSEDEKDVVIKALADVLERHGFACRVANPATPCFCLGCETRAALRLAGRI